MSKNPTHYKVWKKDITAFSECRSVAKQKAFDYRRDLLDKYRLGKRLATMLLRTLYNKQYLRLER